MKKSIFLLILAAVLVSCGSDNNSVDAIINNNDLNAAKDKRKELNDQYRELKVSIDKLNAFIDSHEKEERPALVTAEVINDTIFKHFVAVQGNVETDQNVVLHAEYSGILTHIYVKEGQSVHKGQ